MQKVRSSREQKEREKFSLPEMVVIVASHFCSCVVDWLPSFFSSLTVLSTTLEVTITTSSSSDGGGGGGGGGLNMLLTIIARASLSMLVANLYGHSKLAVNRYFLFF